MVLPRPLALLACLSLPVPLQRAAAWEGQGAADGRRVRGRHAHWVLRTADLRRSLDFYRQVFGMRVLRHEENPEACPITCNGRYQTAWSKTMVGYGTEDVSYALELTYNYGVTSYAPGEALEAIFLRPPLPLEDALRAHGALGGDPPERRDGAVFVRGPDGYLASSAVSPGQGRRRRWLAAGMLGRTVDDDGGSAAGCCCCFSEVGGLGAGMATRVDLLRSGRSAAEVADEAVIEAAGEENGKAAGCPLLDVPADDVDVHETPPAHRPSAGETARADRQPADAVSRGDAGDAPPSGAPDASQDSLVALLAQYSLVLESPADSLDSQCTQIERDLELDRVEAESRAEARRVAEIGRLAALESARGAEYDKAMRQNVPIHWGCIMGDAIFATADDQLSIAMDAIDRVGSAGHDFYVGATRSPIHRWLGGETSRGYMDGHCESWSAMRLIGVTSPGDGGVMERTLIQHAKTYSYQCQNKADDNRGMSPQYHCFLYVVFGAV
ncbi:unnamed protein product [Prorocentrum cordatum]|uniref:VOC domain-containing protein n=1 Tax=Prorocentrum cordatum TaxID=2364126 RepID=A0ABN9WNV2_9DINO|nr:unnamed protein product [Polarella glacialis]